MVQITTHGQGPIINLVSSFTGPCRAHPTEYLMFFCLGKKERTCDVPSADLAHPPMASRAAKLRKTRRFMIYVHSKLMVSTEFD